MNQPKILRNGAFTVKADCCGDMAVYDVDGTKACQNHVNEIINKKAVAAAHWRRLAKENA